jgi:hypothetical protein
MLPLPHTLYHSLPAYSLVLLNVKCLRCDIRLDEIRPRLQLDEVFLFFLFFMGSYPVLFTGVIEQRSGK